MGAGDSPAIGAFRQAAQDLRRSSPELFSPPANVVVIPRRLATDPQVYRQWREEASKAGKTLVIEEFSDEAPPRTPS